MSGDLINDVTEIIEDEPCMGDGNRPKFTAYVPVADAGRALRAALRAVSAAPEQGETR